MSLESQNRPTLPPDQRMGCLVTIVNFPRLALFALREKRHEQRQRSQSRELVRKRLEGAKSRNEALAAATLIPRDIVSMLSDEIESFPISERVTFADELQALSDNAFEKFQSSGRDLDRIQGEILLRISHQIRVEAEANQNPRQNS